MSERSKLNFRSEADRNAYCEGLFLSHPDVQDALERAVKELDEKPIPLPPDWFEPKAPKPER